MRPLIEEVSEPLPVLVLHVRTTPVVVPVARKVIVFLESSGLPTTSNLLLQPQGMFDGQEILVKDVGNSLSPTKTATFAGPLVAPDSGLLNTAAASASYVFGKELGKWAKV